MLWLSLCTPFVMLGLMVGLYHLERRMFGLPMPEREAAAPPPAPTPLDARIRIVPPRHYPVAPVRMRRRTSRPPVRG